MLNSDKIRELRMGTIKDIKDNRDLTLYCDVKQKFEMKCPKDFYERCLAYIKANKRVFDDKDYKIMKLRYGEAKSTKNIGDIIGFSEPSICYRIKNSLYKLKRNIKRISESSIYANEKPVEVEEVHDDFEKGYWNGEKISEMHYNHLVNALEYATQTKQHDKVKELTAEIEKREGTEKVEKRVSMLDMVKAYSEMLTDIKKYSEKLEKLEKTKKDFEQYFEQVDEMKGV